MFPSLGPPCTAISSSVCPGPPDPTYAGRSICIVMTPRRCIRIIVAAAERTNAKATRRIELAIVFLVVAMTFPIDLLEWPKVRANEGRTIFGLEHEIRGIRTDQGITLTETGLQRCREQQIGRASCRE